MAKCDIIPQINREGKSAVDSVLYPKLLEFTNNDRARATELYKEIFSGEFRDWFGDWTELSTNPDKVLNTFDIVNQNAVTQELLNRERNLSSDAHLFLMSYMQEQLQIDWPHKVTKTSHQVLNTLLKIGTIPDTLRPLAELMLEGPPMPVMFDDGEMNIVGIYDPSEEAVAMNVHYLQLPTQFSMTVLHELLHFYTYYQLREGGRFAETMEGYYEEVKEYLKEINPDALNQYALSDIDEFVVGLFTDPELIENLQKNETLWDKIVKLIRSIFKQKEDSDDLYTKATDRLLKHINFMNQGAEFVGDDYIQDIYGVQERVRGKLMRASKVNRSQIVEDTGEPLLVSPSEMSPVKLYKDIRFVNSRPYGKGVVFKAGDTGKLQAGYINVRNPLRMENLDTEAIKQTLQDKAHFAVPQEILDRIDGLNEYTDPKKATRELEKIIEDYEFETSTNFWSHKQDIRNVWESFGFDGIIDGDTYVLFNEGQYWSTWNNDAKNVLPEPDPEPVRPVMDKQERIIRKLSAKFGATVTYNRDIPGGTIARVRREGQNVSIEVHPDRIQHDTVYHEFAHIMIDGLGGLSNPQVARGVQLLKGTELWNRVAERYPELKGDRLAKEVLAEAIGLEASNMDITNLSVMEQVKNWVELLFRRIQKLFGIDNTTIRSLARTLLSDELSVDFNIENMPEWYQEQRTRSRRDMKALRKKNAIYDEIISQIDIRINELRRRSDNTEATQFRKIKHKLKQDLDEVILYQGLIDYIEQADGDLNEWYQSLVELSQSDNLTADQLDRYYTAAQTYRNLADIDTLVQNNPKIAKELGAEYVQMLDTLKQTLNGINTIYQEQSLELSVQFLKKGARKKRAQIEMEYEKEFNAKHRDNYDSKEQFKKDRAAYVERRIQANREEIEFEIEESIREQLYMAQQDTGSIEMWMTSMKNVNDEILQIVSEAVDKAEYSVIQDTNKLEREIEAVVAPLREYKGNPSDPAKLFEDIIETDAGGNPTGFIVSEFHSSFREKEKAFYDNNAQAKARDYKLYAARRRQFYKENAKRNPEWENWRVIREKKEKELPKDEFDLWMQDNRPPRKYIPNDKYRNEKYNKLDASHKDYLGDDHPVVRFYNFYLRKQKNYDDMLPDPKALGYRFPAIKKSSMERLLGADLSGTMQNAKDMFRWTVDDTSEGELEQARDKKGNVIYVRKNAKGETVKYIPIHYRGDIEAKDRSYDVANLLLMNGHMSMNYNYKNQILADLKLVSEQIRRRKVKQYKGGKQQMLSDGRPHTEPGELSRSYRLLKNFMDFRVYGRSTAEDDFLVDYSKQIGQFMSYTGALLLGGNVISGIANMNIGETLTFIESVGGQHFSMKDLGKAQKFYAKNVANGSLLADIGNSEYNSIVNLMMKQFDSLNTYYPWSFKPGESNRAVRLFKRDAIYAVNNLGEHKLHNITMLAFLNRIKVTDAEGNYLDAEGNQVADKSKAASLLDTYENKNGELALPEAVKKVEWDGKYYQLGNDLNFRITQKIRQVNEYMHGAYADQNSNLAQRYNLGRMGLMMRKWMEPGIRRRFAGITRYQGISQRGTWYDERGMAWDHQMDELHEGIATTSIRTLVEAFYDKGNFIQALQANWGKMSDMERSNIHKMVTELGIMLISLAAASMFYGMAKDAGDDDEANRYWFMGYMANRLYTELVVYHPPFNINEVYRVLKSPAATIAVYERFGRLFRQIPNIGERYEGGRRRGELKIEKYTTDVFPFFGHIDRLKNMEDLVQFVYRE